MEAAEDANSDTRSGRTIVIVMVAAAVAIALYFALGMPGMDHSTSTPAAGHEQMET